MPSEYLDEHEILNLSLGLLGLGSSRSSVKLTCLELRLVRRVFCLIEQDVLQPPHLGLYIQSVITAFTRDYLFLPNGYAMPAAVESVIQPRSRLSGLNKQFPEVVITRGL